jgi:hypothetical protein
MVKAPIVSRVGDHKRQDLHIRPANRHYVASGGPCVSPQQSAHIGRSAVRRGIGLTQCGTLTMPLPNPHERIEREHRDIVDVERRIDLYRRPAAVDPRQAPAARLFPAPRRPADRAATSPRHRVDRAATCPPRPAADRARAARVPVAARNRAAVRRHPLPRRTAIPSAARQRQHWWHASVSPSQRALPPKRPNTAKKRPRRICSDGAFFVSEVQAFWSAFSMSLIGCPVRSLSSSPLRRLLTSLW